MTQAEQISKLQEQILELHAQNEELKKEQQEFMTALMDEVEKIEATNSFWKYFQYIKLVVDMIATIKEFAKKKQA